MPTQASYYEKIRNAASAIHIHIKICKSSPFNKPRAQKFSGWKKFFENYSILVYKIL